MPEETQEKKYELLPGDWIEIIDKNHKKHVLHRIRAIRDFDDVKAGDYGGYVESEDNLNQYDNSWIYSDAVRISKNARAWGNCRVSGNSKLYNSAEVCDYAVVCDDAALYEDCKVHGKAKVYGKCQISGISTVGENAKLDGEKIIIKDNAIISGHASISGKVWIEGVTIVDEHALIKGENIKILGDHVYIKGYTEIKSNANIVTNDDFITVDNLGENRNTLTSYLTKDNVIMMVIGGGYSEKTYDDFLNWVTDNLEEEKFKEEYRSFSEVIKQRFINNRPATIE